MTTSSKQLIGVYIIGLVGTTCSRSVAVKLFAWRHIVVQKRRLRVLRKQVHPAMHRVFIRKFPVPVRRDPGNRCQYSTWAGRTEIINTHNRVFITSGSLQLYIGYICISNSMVSGASWEKHAWVRFSKTIKIARVRRTSTIWSLWKTHECMFFQIARETILLLIKRQLFSMSRICNEKCSKPKIFLAFLSESLCFSFIL
jgi:hypothetical protein